MPTRCVASAATTEGIAFEARAELPLGAIRSTASRSAQRRLRPKCRLWAPVFGDPIVAEGLRSGGEALGHEFGKQPLGVLVGFVAAVEFVEQQHQFVVCLTNARRVACRCLDTHPGLIQLVAEPG